MRLTERRRKAIQLLLDAVIDQDALMDEEEYRYAVALVEHALVDDKRTPSYKEIEMGKKIKCACGNEECYHMIEVFFEEFFLYEDQSDRHAPLHHFCLPKRYELVERKR